MDDETVGAVPVPRRQLSFDDFQRWLADQGIRTDMIVQIEIVAEFPGNDGNGMMALKVVRHADSFMHLGTPLITHLGPQTVTEIHPIFDNIGLGS
jgi:hypothetical protein